MGNNPLDMLDGFDAKKTLALISRLGGREIVDDFLAGDKKVTFEDVVRICFDKNGRFIIPEGFAFGHTDPNKNYYCDQPARFDFASLVERGARYFPQGMKLPSAAQVEDGCRLIKEQIMADQQVSNLFTGRGIRLPWFLPQVEIDPKNPGKAIHHLFKPTIKAAYESDLKGRKFVDYRESDTDGQVTVVDESQLRLIDALSKGPVFGWIFPAVFQGIGIEGARALMKMLSAQHNFVLGGFDSLAAMILHPAILARDNNTPAMDLASFQWQDPRCSLYLLAFDGKLRFDFRDLNPFENCSAAVSVFRQ